MFRVLAQEGGPLEVVFGSFENTWLWIVLAISLVALACSPSTCARRSSPRPRGPTR